MAAPNKRAARSSLAGIESRVDKYRQRAKLLTNRPDFKADVRRIRKEWEIPTRGFPRFKLGKPSMQPIQIWDRELQKRTEEYYDQKWPDAQKRIDALTKQGKLRDAHALRQKTKNNAPAAAFKIEIRELAKKYDLPKSWEKGLRTYVLVNYSPLPETGAWVAHKLDEDNMVTDLSIRLTEATRLEDVKKMWGMVKLLQQNMRGRTPKKLQPLHYADRDQRVIKLAEQGKKDREIAEVIHEEFGMPLDAEGIRTIRRNYAKRQGAK